MPTVTNKARYISVAVTTEGEQTRQIPGSPPNPAPPAVQFIWVAGASCEILRFNLTDRDDTPPEVNIQGALTNLTGPLGNDFSFTTSLDLDSAKNIYSLGQYTLSDELTQQWNINVYAPTANGNVAPTRIISGGSPIVTQANGTSAMGATSVAVIDTTGFVNGGPVGIYVDSIPEWFLTSVNGTPSGGNIMIADALPGNITDGHNVMALLNPLNYLWLPSGSGPSSGPSAGIAVDPSNNIYVGGGGLVDAYSAPLQQSADTTAKSILWKFASGATGNAQPTVLHDFGYTVTVHSITYDPTRQWIWVAGRYTGTNNGFVMAFDTIGTMQRDIEGLTTTLVQPNQIAIASDGTIGVAQRKTSGTGGSVVVFAATANGNVAPERTYTDASFASYNGLVLDSDGNSYVSTSSPVQLSVFPFSSSGTVMPSGVETADALFEMDDLAETFPLNLRVS